MRKFLEPCSVSRVGDREEDVAPLALDPVPNPGQGELFKFLSCAYDCRLLDASISGPHPSEQKLAMDFGVTTQSTKFAVQSRNLIPYFTRNITTAFHDVVD